MANRTRTRYVVVVAAATASLLSLQTMSRASSQAGTRTVYVSALGDKEAPVADLTAADLTVKEDGKPREIVSAEIAKTPLQVVLMLDDSGLALGAIRQGAGQFVEALQGKAEFAIITMGGRNLPYVDFTGDPPTLYAALQKLFARNSPPTYILDGFLEAAQTFIRRKAERPVIVAVATEGEELSNARAEVVLDAIQKSGAKLFWIGLGPPSTQGTRPALSADRPADSTESESGKRNAVLGAAPKNSGGRSEQALQSSGVPVMMKQFAAELAGQYAITYKTDSTEAKLSVETKRKGVKLRAPSRVGAR
jgi:VWFA-related protein